MSTEALTKAQELARERLEDAIRGYANAVAWDQVDAYLARAPQGRWKPAWDRVQDAIRAALATKENRNAG